MTKHFSNEVELEVDTRRVKENIKEWIESSQMEIESKKELKELLVKLKFVSKLDQGGSKEVNFDVVYTFGDVKLSLHCEENQKRGVNYEIRNQSDRIVLCKALFNETMRWRAPECLPFLMKELNLTVTTHKKLRKVPQSMLSFVECQMVDERCNSMVRLNHFKTRKFKISLISLFQIFNVIPHVAFSL